MARVKERQGDWNGALAEWRELVRMQPKSCSTRLALADCLRFARREAEALEQVNEVIRLDSNSADAYALRSAIRLDSGDLVAAEADVIRALALEPSSGVALRQLGALRIGQNRADEALETLNRALQLEPYSAFGYEMRSKAHRLKGNEAAARADEAKMKGLLGGGSK